jgi:O-antigen polymerase
MTPYRWLFGCIALLAFGVLQFNLPNLGNNLIPRNFFGWAVLILATAGVLIYAVRQPRFFWSNWAYLWLVPPSFVLIHSIAFPAAMPHYALLAASALMGFSLWLVALLQARLTDLQWYRLSLLMLFGAVILVLLALPSSNYLNHPHLLRDLPVYLRLPEGGFQQKNVFATFLSSALLWAWGMRVRAVSEDRVSDWPFSIAIFSVAFAIFLSSSGVAGLGLIVGLILLLIYFVHGERQRFRQGLWLPGLTVVGALLLSIYLPAEDVVAGAADLSGGKNTMLRVSFWQVSWAVGLDAPWFGHGLGSFSEVYHPEYVAQVRSGVEHLHTNYLNHPHNETLLWWVETGAIGLVMVILPWVISIWFLGIWKNPAAFLFMAALGPMLLHSQTEFPLHTSGVHWLLAGMIIVSTMRRDLIPEREMALKPIWPGVIATLGTIAFVVVVHTGWLSYQNWTRGMRAPLSFAEEVQRRLQDPEVNHFILGTEAMDFWMLTLTRGAVSSGNQAWLEDIRPAVEDVQNRWQGPLVWGTLAEVYRALGDIESLRRHVEFVEALQPESGAKLREHYRDLI